MTHSITKDTQSDLKVLFGTDLSYEAISDCLTRSKLTDD